MATVNHLGIFPNEICIVETDISPVSPTIEFSSNMIGMSLEEAMATYWKVKEWNVYAGNSELEIDAGAIFIEEENNGAENERDLVCSGGGSRYSYAIPPYEDPNSAGESLQVSITINFNLYTVYLYDDLYYPQIEFFWINNPVTITNVGKIDGEKLRFFCELDWAEQDVKWRVEIFPKTYWEYDPNDGGGPIYDKDTGERIRNDI